MRAFVAVGVSLTLIACAQSPDRIASTQVSDETYQTYKRFVAVSAVPMPCEIGITVSTERPWVHE
jgi:hypothetical protein